MNREDIIRMARDAKMPFYWRTGEITYLDKLEALATLVASAERDNTNNAYKERNQLVALLSTLFSSPKA